jgi:lipopolysaccharide exporter
VGYATQSAGLESRFSARVIEEGLRHHTARGTIINAVFQIGLAALTLGRRVIVAAFLTATEFGVWSAVLATLLLVGFIKEAGIGDKFIQQDDENQEHAFQRYFTINLLLNGVVLALAVIALPLFALAYGSTEIIAPGLALTLVLVTASFQAPILVFYRQMEFVKQRTLQTADPVVAFVVTVALAIAGLGYWSLVIGAILGSVAGAVVALRSCPYRIGFRLERGAVREYWSFSWPLAVARGEGLAVGQATLLIATRTMSLGAAGAIGLATSFGQFSRGVDSIVTQTLYPAICAVRDRRDLLLEAFMKSNRLALMWGMPFGIALALFAPDLVHFVLGDRWESAVVVLQAFGVITALDQVGFNWTAFLRALDYTRPMATIAVLDVIVFCAVTAPLLIVFGLEGFAVGVLVGQLVNLAARTWYLRVMFPAFVLARQAARAVAPTVPAVAVVLLSRLIENGERTAAIAGVELTAFCLVTIAATIVFERSLLREVLGYLRRRSGAPAVGPDAPLGAAS